MNIINENNEKSKRYLPHELHIRENAVKTIKVMGLSILEWFSMAFLVGLIIVAGIFVGIKWKKKK